MNFDTSKIDRSTIIKAAILVIVVVTAYFFIRKAVKKLKSDKEQNKLDAEVKANELSYPLNQYFSMADQIEGSFTYLTTDEQAIYNVFKKMNTLSDVLQLNKSFGVRKYYGFFGDASLALFIQKGMTQKEVDQVNAILKKNNINFSF